jgi:hypothetical protein
MTLGTNVFATQYVAIQNKAESIIGTGSGTLGYGQTVQSSDVFSGNTITKAQWDLLRYDIVAEIAEFYKTDIKSCLVFIDKLI